MQPKMRKKDRTVEEKEDGRSDGVSTGRVETKGSPSCRISKATDFPH